MKTERIIRIMLLFIIFIPIWLFSPFGALVAFLIGGSQEVKMYYRNIFRLPYYFTEKE